MMSATRSAMFNGICSTDTAIPLGSGIVELIDPTSLAACLASSRAVFWKLSVLFSAEMLYAPHSSEQRAPFLDLASGVSFPSPVLMSIVPLNAGLGCDP